MRQCKIFTTRGPRCKNKCRGRSSVCTFHASLTTHGMRMESVEEEEEPKTPDASRTEPPLPPESMFAFHPVRNPPSNGFNSVSPRTGWMIYPSEVNRRYERPPLRDFNDVASTAFEADRGNLPEAAMGYTLDPKETLPDDFISSINVHTRGRIRDPLTPQMVINRYFNTRPNQMDSYDPRATHTRLFRSTAPYDEWFTPNSRASDGRNSRGRNVRQRTEGHGDPDFDPPDDA
eukprot:jgi/Mesvir1/18625/Mv17134-RA.1